MIDMTHVTKPLTRKLCKLWIDALRSGTFLQGHGKLERNGRYCCLGVLNKIADLGVPDHYSTLARDDGSMVALPRHIQSQLWNRNDGNPAPSLSFDKISDYIEAKILPNLPE